MNSEGFSSKSCRTTLILMAFTAMMVMFIDIMLVPALQYITMDFPDYAEWISWILSIYLLVGAVMNPIVGKLADLYGKRKLLLITITIYTIGLIGCALMYNDFLWLIVFRALQGVGLTMFPLFFGIIRDTFPKDMVSISIGIVSAMFSIGVSIGLLGGGWIVSQFEWEYCYYLMAPLFVILAAIFYFKIRDAGIFEEGRKVDMIGAAFLSSCILSLLVALTLYTDNWMGNPVVPLCLSIFLVSLVLFIVRERRIDEPLINLRLLTGGGAGAHITAFLFGIAMFMLFQTLPFLLSSPEAYGGFAVKNTFEIGLIMFPMAIMGLIFGPIAGKWCKKPGHSMKVLAAGMFFFALGDLMLILMHSELWMIVLSMCVSGVGNAMAMVSMINVVVETSPAKDFGMASGMNTMFRLIGGSIGPILGTAILSGYVVTSIHAVKIYGIDGYIWTWVAGAIFCLIGTVMAYFLKSRSDVQPA